MSVKSSGRLRIPQWAIVSRVVTAFDITTNEYDVETSRARTDLTGSVVHFTVRDASGTIVIQKTSADIAEIEILDQVLPATTVGQARVYFLEADTGALTVGEEYWFDCWAADGTSEEPIVDRGKFIVCESVTHISAGPAPSLPTYPAPQLPQERSFHHTWSATGASDAVTIPGGESMVDTDYIVLAMVEDGTPVSFTAASGSRTTTGFTLLASASLTINDTVSVYLRDRA